jgi:hypothetical protein
MPPAPP